jgi:murein L,D-transpeptidase YafK
VCLVAVAGALLSQRPDLFALDAGMPKKRAIRVATADTATTGHDTNRTTTKVPLPARTDTAAPEGELEGSGEGVEERLEGVWYPPDTMRYLLLANKADKRLYLLRRRGDWEVARAYPAAYGENGGRKQTSGDKRTPEGLYFIIGHKKPRELTEVYGPVAFVLNYPNARDRRDGRTGTGIWIHGTAPDSMPVSTRGCIELTNSDIDELERIIDNGIGTPVLIVDDPAMQNAAVRPDYREVARRRAVVMRTYRRRLEAFARLVKQWREAWESRDIERYRIFYDTTNFAARGQEWGAWRARKLRTFRNYDTIDVSVSDIILTDFQSHRAIVKFHQKYQSNVLTSRNVKALFLTRTNGSWKITRETTLPVEEFVL